VRLPAGWNAAAQGLDLTREGDQLSGSFEPPPPGAPVLALTVQAPYRKVPSTNEVAGWWLGGLILGVLLCPLIGWVAAVLLLRRNVNTAWGMLVSALAGVAVTVGLLLIVLQATRGSGVPDNQQSWTQADNSPLASLGRALFGMAGFFASILAGALGFGLAQITLWNVVRHRRRRRDPYDRDPYDRDAYDRDDTDPHYRPRDLR